MSDLDSGELVYISFFSKIKYDCVFCLLNSFFLKIVLNNLVAWEPAFLAKLSAQIEIEFSN